MPNDPWTCTRGDAYSATYVSGEWELRHTTALGFGWERCVVLRNGEHARTVLGFGDVVRRAQDWVGRKIKGDQRD